jgi:DHA1 family bicyclomycin/chloramphenicol resistance-like MFS transporter
VLGRAIVRDTSGPTDSARRLALMNLMMTLGPGLAPIVGGVLASTLGWRWIFYMLTLLGACGLLLAWRRLPETGGRGRPSSVGELARNYRQLLGSRAFIGFSIGGGCATTSLYAYTASAPFIFEQQLGRSTHEVGVYLAILMLGISIGSFATSRLVMRIATPRLIVGANLLSLFASIVMLAGIASGHLSVPLMVGGMFMFSIGAGVASPAALTSAVSINPQVIGSASGLYGFTQMAVGGICTTLVGFGANPALAAAAVLTGAGVISQLMFWMALRVRPAATPSA